MLLNIIGCSLVGSVLLIGLCAPLSAAFTSTVPSRADAPSIAIEESVRDDWHANADRSGITYCEGSGRKPTESNLRKWIASSSVPILRARGMTDEEIKAELLRDFDLTEEQVDEILTAQ